MKPHYPTTIHNNAGTLSTGEPAPRLLAVCHSRWNRDSTQSDHEQTLANAQRLTACWNACHGLDLPPDIPAGAVENLVAAARALLDQEQWEADEYIPPDSPVGRTIAALAPFAWRD